MKTRGIAVAVSLLLFTWGCSSGPEPETQTGGTRQELSARAKEQTITITTTSTSTTTGTVTTTATSTYTATSTASGTQTLTGTKTVTGTITSTRTGSITASQTASATDYYNVTGTLSGTMTVTAYYLSWTGTSTNTVTNTRTTTVTGPIQSTFVLTKTATNTVTNSRNGTETKTATAAATGFLTFTGTTTVTATNTVTRTNGQREGSGTRAVTASGTGVQTSTAAWTWLTTSTYTRTGTLTDTRTVTTTSTGTNTVTTTSTQTTTNTRTSTGTTTQVITITTTSTATQTATDDGGVPDSGLSCLQNWRSSGTCGQWCTRETQSDRAACSIYLDCYLSHGCGPATCGKPDDVCGVNVLDHGSVPKTIADQVYQCLGCPGSTPVTSCNNPLLPDGTPCTDGNACTLGDACRAGACVAGSPVPCTALDQCHVAGTCNSATGLCSNPNKADGTTCNDGNACTTPDLCQTGVCVGTAVLSPPTGLTATAGSGRVGLNWNAASGATSYYVKRSLTAGGPYTAIATVLSPGYVDNYRAIGPTYYYVVTAVASCGESAPSNEASATPFSSKAGTFPPGPGPCKLPPSAATSATVATTGTVLMDPPTAIVATPGTGPKEPKVVRALASVAAHYSARVRYQLTMNGSQAVVTPTFAAQIPGALVPNPALSDRILVLGRANRTVNFVTTVADPRIRRTMLNPVAPSNVATFMGTSGSLSVDLPEAMLDPSVLSQTVFEFYTMPNTVPTNTPVSTDALSVLMSGAKLIATSNGGALSAMLSPTSP